MRELSHSEKLIVKELIKNPRISDNQIFKNTKIPVKSVNRKRKKLEQENLIYYFTHLDNTLKGTALFSSKQLYIISLKRGITRFKFLDSFKHTDFSQTITKHSYEAHLAEENGCLKLLLFIESYMDSDIIEIFNADYLPKLESIFGKDCIIDVTTLKLNNTLQIFHNYFPELNMKNGIMKEENKGNIFIG